MTTQLVELVRGSYRDSVRLMQISQSLLGVPGVHRALVAMATDLNVELAAGMGFTVPPGAGPNDMLVAVSGADDAAVQSARGRLRTELDAAPLVRSTSGAVPPRTVGSAVRESGANLVLVSTPGRYAVLDAWDALDTGASVLLFSDNIPLRDEIALKDAATARGLLLMGPDCGTAVVGGVGLGFANVVRPGPVGLVAASGTGAQQVMCLLDAAGVGISHCLGVGGRDLSAEVAGRGTRAALSTLDADPDTGTILVLAKPPDPAVAAALRVDADALRKKVHFGLLGPGEPDLTSTVEQLLAALGRPVPEHWPVWHPDPPVRQPRASGLRGLYCGGSLRDEAVLIAAQAPGAGDDLFIDFGDDEYTRGRPHPMIDGSLRLARLAAECSDPACGVILLDVVLGYAADPDPAATLAPAIAAAPVPVVVALIGTAGDPQDRDRQAGALCRAGATVFASNAQATRYALELCDRG